MARAELEGLPEVVRNFEQFNFRTKQAKSKYLDLIGQSAITLLKQNTPKDSGELANSWKVLHKDSNSVTVGVPDAMEGLLVTILEGSQPHDIRPQDPDGALSFLFRGERVAFRRIRHPGTRPNDFMARVDSAINGIMKSTMSSILRSQHRFWQPVTRSGGKTPNASKVVGLTGTKFRGNRFAGRATLSKRTGRGSGSSRSGTRVVITRKRKRGPSFQAQLKKLNLG